MLTIGQSYITVKEGDISTTFHKNTVITSVYDETALTLMIQYRGSDGENNTINLTDIQVDSFGNYVAGIN